METTAPDRVLFSFLLPLVEDRLSREEFAEAGELLGEAHRVLDENPTVNYYNVLDVAGLDQKTGRTTEARVLFERVLGLIPANRQVHERDDIRCAIAAKYSKLNLVPESLVLVRQIEDVARRSGMFREIARMLAGHGDQRAAVNILLSEAVETIRLQPKKLSDGSDNISRQEQWLLLARWLAERDEHEAARSVLGEFISTLSNTAVNDARYLGRAALLLLAVGGARDRVIHILTDGWFYEDDGRDLSGDKLEDIRERFPQVYAELVR